jgi:hypothetical protein
MEIVRRGVAFAWLVLLEIGVVVVLHRMGSLPWLRVDATDLGGWLATTAPEDVLAAVLRLVALVCALWLLGSTVLYAVARLSRLPHLIAAVEWATLPVVRRAIDRSIAVALSATTVVAMSPPLAHAVEAPPAASADGAAVRVTQAAAAPAGQLTAALVVPPAFPSPAAVPFLEPAERLPEPAVTPPANRGASPRAVTPAPTPAASALLAGVERSTPELAAPATQQVIHRVARGENLWVIASARLASATGRSVADLPGAEVHAYWRRVLAANAGLLRSGDPDVVFPGEPVVLPSP